MIPKENPEDQPVNKMDIVEDVPGEDVVERQYTIEKDSVRAWIMLACACVILILVGALLVGVSPVFFVVLLDEFGESKEKTAWVGSIATAMMAFPGPFAAMIASRLGSLKTSLLGTVLMATGVLASSFAPNVEIIILTFSLIAGFGGGVAYNVSYSAVIRVFDKYQSLAVGLISSALSLGYLSLTPLVQYCVSAIGLRKTYRVLAGMCVPPILASFAFPLNDHKVKTRSKSVFSDLSILKIGAYNVVTVFHSLAFLVYYIPLQHMLQHAEEQGVPREDTFFFMTYFGIASGIFRTIIGRLVDRYRRIRFLNLYISQSCLVGFGILTIIICYTNSYYSFLMYYVLYGIFDAGYLGQQCSIVLKCIDYEDQLPLAWGIFTFCFSFSNAFGGPIGGLLADTSNSYHLSFFLTAGVVIFSAAGMLLAPWYKAKRLRKVAPSASTTPEIENQARIH